MRTKLVILDWAGTTVDYGCFAPVKAFDRAFRAWGVEATEEEIRKPMGLLKRDHIRTMLQMPSLRDQWIKQQGREPDESSVQAVYEIFEGTLMESLEEYASPKPDTLEGVGRLREMGLQIGSTTGYTDAMMEVVTRRAAQEGYAPDVWYSPDGVGGLGRPYPYMIYENMRHFRLASVEEVIKVGDTASDIREGKQAGVISLGVLEGSSVLGMTQEEYEALTLVERQVALDQGRKILLQAGADDVLLNLRDLPAWIENLPHHFSAMASISTKAPLGRAAT